jgi:hypothetical protein
MEIIRTAYDDWFDKYCEEHPEFDGHNDAACDAFWTACEKAGFLLEANVASILLGETDM